MGRLGGSHAGHGPPLAKRVVESAKQLAIEFLNRSGGIGLVVDAANGSLIATCEKFDFRQVAPGSLRWFLQTVRLLDPNRLVASVKHWCRTMPSSAFPPVKTSAGRAKKRRLWAKAADVDSARRIENQICLPENMKEKEAF